MASRQLYNYRGSLALGFHGCRKEVAKKLVANPEDIRISENDWDWLGAGFYIWENNLERAEEWAVRTYGEDAAVVGVVYELGNCLDLMETSSIGLVKDARDEYVKYMHLIGASLPSNKDLKRDANHDKLLRYMDCAVINYLTDRTDLRCAQELKDNGYSEHKAFDTIRGCFNEGAKLDGMEIYEKTHIQIAIRNMNCIKGLFLPREERVFPLSLTID